MPRKSKEEKNELNIEKKTVAKKITNKKVTNKKDSAKKSVTTKSAKKADTSSKSAKGTKSTKSSKSIKKSKSTKKASPSNVARAKKKNTSSNVSNVEYYDLPFRYNQTIVKILAQTPNVLFIYWDISDEDRQSYIKKYGEEFFNHTKPYLTITNETMNYTFEVEINDFANSWYLHINDANCDYKIELGRKFITNSNNELSNSKFTPYSVNDYVSITSSNEIETPNDHILFDKLGNNVFFRNVKTDIVEQRNIYSLSFLQKISKVYNIYDLYRKIYNDELISDTFELNLPSSSSSPTFK